MAWRGGPGAGGRALRDKLQNTADAAVLAAVGDSCIIALDPSRDDALRIGRTATVEMSCGASVNSTDNRKIQANGSSLVQ